MEISITRKVFSYVTEDYDIAIGETDSYGLTEIIVTDDDGYTFSVWVDKNDVDDEEAISFEIKRFLEERDEADRYHNGY